ncbi:Inner membrane protein YbaL [Pseudobythopirellula maris]|uniref:Inner membrane protein YbaL n=1 Tax=Pseudobythopirellula maris TaxID=2527991 RepID=A0A5C5ZNP3_9BACT|nr:potassium channel protein [Pseudobythopirellula maris]TWT88810.1 Inner membrane protein YbaL [Pseudobythopirellula maris]
MQVPLKRLLTTLVFFLTTCALAATVYMAHGWEAADALYMVVITIFGVGYGEVRPIDTLTLRTVTMMLIVVSYGCVIYIAGGFIQMVMEGEINRALSRRRMTRGIDELVGHTILCGFGRAGRILALELKQAGAPFVVIDQDEAKLNDAEAQGMLILEGNAIEEDVLTRARVHEARVLATVLPDDAANVFITLTARELSPELEIIARAENPSTEKKLLRSGANRVVLPAVIGGQRMAHLITRPGAEEMLADATGQADLRHELEQIGLKLDELPIAAGSPLDGGTVGDIDLKGNRAFLVVAVRRADGGVAVDPPAEFALTGGDTVLVLGHANELPQLARRYAATKEILYRGARMQTPE